MESGTGVSGGLKGRSRPRGVPPKATVCATWYPIFRPAVGAFLIIGLPSRLSTNPCCHPAAVLVAFNDEGINRRLLCLCLTANPSTVLLLVFFAYPKLSLVHISLWTWSPVFPHPKVTPQYSLSLINSVKHSILCH